MGANPVPATPLAPRRLVFDLEMSRFGPGVKGRVFSDPSGVNRADSVVIFTIPPTCHTFPLPDQDEAWEMLNFRIGAPCVQGLDRVLVVALPAGQRLATSLRNLGLILGQEVVPAWAAKEVDAVPPVNPGMGMG